MAALNQSPSGVTEIMDLTWSTAALAAEAAEDAAAQSPKEAAGEEAED